MFGVVHVHQYSPVASPNSYVFGVVVCHPPLRLGITKWGEWSCGPYGKRGPYGHSMDLFSIISSIPERLCVRGMYMSVAGHYDSVYKRLGVYRIPVMRIIRLSWPYGPGGLCAQYKNTFPNRYVSEISPSPSQAIMALCIERGKIWSW